ncbi:proline--tRNA ligase [Candidatus Providencia siddallii]|uniref:Proline--tRNA ligase n=1 Tax=Candidatus Providencia siddallii TaxID=1715285 RepID=A0ABM9NNW5_9GAMM
MRASKYLFLTLKKTSNDSENIIYELMLRAGMIYKISSGIYSWLPTGLRVLHKIKNIIREEMNNIGAIELSLPIVQPIKLWEKSGRSEQYGFDLFRLFDRRKRSFILGPTHEEVISDLISNFITSYKQLPIILFQIQTKFRDETRPRFGVVRAREFLMKDAYSFHFDQESLKKTYNIMYNVYSRIFTRIGLKFYVVKADTGSMGGNCSHEFQVLSKNGEDNIVFSNKSNFAANLEFAESVKLSLKPNKPKEKMCLIDIKSTSDLINKFNFSIKKIIKTLIVHGSKKSSHSLIALLIRGDHDVNVLKLEKHPLISKPLKFATKKEIETILNIKPEFLGPINISVPIIADYSVALMSDFIIGSNIEGKYYIGVNWVRDIHLPSTYDLRNVSEGDPSPDGKGILQIKRGIEIAHIFQLGTKYSESMKIFVHDKKGINKFITMGCYGIGITRIIAAIIEQSYDEHGIIFPDIIAPFQVAILPVNMNLHFGIKKIVETLYIELKQSGIDVILDDRDERIGVMFADVELIGVPHIIIVGNNNLKINKVEYKFRPDKNKVLIDLNNIVNFLKEKILN